MSTNLVLNLLNRTEEDIRWFDNNRESIIKEFDGKFIAIKEEGIVTSGNSVQEVVKELKSKNFNPAETLIRFVSKIKMIL